MLHTFERQQYKSTKPSFSPHGGLMFPRQTLSNQTTGWKPLAERVPFTEKEENHLERFGVGGETD